MIHEKLFGFVRCHRCGNVWRLTLHCIAVQCNACRAFLIFNFIQGHATNQNKDLSTTQTQRRYAKLHGIIFCLCRWRTSTLLNSSSLKLSTKARGASFQPSDSNAVFLSHCGLLGKRAFSAPTINFYLRSSLHCRSRHFCSFISSPFDSVWV